MDILWIYGYMDIWIFYGFMDIWTLYGYMDILWIKYLRRLWIWPGCGVQFLDEMDYRLD